MKQADPDPAQPWGLFSRPLQPSPEAYVFPSEITARFWARRSLAAGGPATLLTDRFLSWDEFKARALEYPDGGRPVNRAARLLFLGGFLEGNRGDPSGPRLRRLVPPERADAFLPYLAGLERMLPALHLVQSVRWPQTSEDKRRDLLLLHREYGRHLRNAGLYEPAWERPALREDGRRYRVFWPELIEDFGEFAALLQGSGRVSTVPVPSSPPGPVRLQGFATVREELRALLAEAASLLDSGVAAEQIAVTVGGLPEVEGPLLRLAGLYGVPLAVRHGSPPDRFPVTRLFVRLLDCAEQSMSLTALKALLLDRVIPWRQERLGRELVRLGIEGKVLANRGGHDAWLQALQALRALRRAAPRAGPASPAPARLEGYYRSLAVSIETVSRSRGFRELKERLAGLAGEFLDLSRWSQQEMAVYQFCLDSLDDLEAEAAAAPLPAALPPWKLWLEYLRRLRYVPQRPAAGIPVYPYRVAEGIRPAHHLLAGLSQDATLHRQRRYPFLAAHEEQGLEDAVADLSAGHLCLYCHSGERVSFSYARSRQGRVHLPPAWFITLPRQADAAGPAAAPATAGEGQTLPGGPPAPDPYEAESAAWRSAAGPSPWPLLAAQARGYAAARPTVLQDRAAELTRGPLPDPALGQRLLARLLGEDQQLRLSATALESFSACPLRYLFEKALGLGGETYESALVDPREFGSLLHAVVQRFFGGLLASGGAALDPSRRSAYTQLLHEAVEEEFRGFEAAHPAALRPVWESLRNDVQELAEACLERELTDMAGEHTLEVETWLQALLPGGEAGLVGKIDRVTAPPAPPGAEAEGRSAERTLVEYKKNRLPTRPAIFGPEPTSFQLPFYAYLMQAQGWRVRRAVYYSFQQKRFRSFLRPGSEAEQGQLREAIEATLQRLRDMSRSLREGDYSGPPASGAAAGCSACQFPALCRRRYLVGD